MFSAIWAGLGIWRLAVYGAVLLALVGSVWRIHYNIKESGREEVRAEYQAAAEAQREANRARVTVAEQKQAAQTIYRDRYITKTVKEIQHVTQNLAACVVADPAVGMLNDAARCASEDRSASCGAGDGLPAPAGPAKGSERATAGQLDYRVDRGLRLRAQ